MLQTANLFDKNYNLPGLYFVSPHDELIYVGQKTLILKKRNYDKYINKRFVLCGKDYAYGVITLTSSQKIESEKKFLDLKDKHCVTPKEVDSWWGTYNLHVYTFKLEPFEKPIRYLRPHGIQTIIKQVVYDVVKD